MSLATCLREWLLAWLRGLRNGGLLCRLWNERRAEVVEAVHNTGHKAHPPPAARLLDGHVGEVHELVVDVPAPHAEPRAAEYGPRGIVSSTIGVNDHTVTRTFGKNDQTTKWMTRGPAAEPREPAAVQVHPQRRGPCKVNNTPATSTGVV